MPPKNKKKNKQATDAAQEQAKEDLPEDIPQPQTADSPPLPKMAEATSELREEETDESTANIGSGASAH